MNKVVEIVKGIDFESLREQKLTLLNVIHNKDALPLDKRIIPVDCIDGIIHMIDAIQDAAVQDGIKTEAEVFGEEEQDEH